MKNHFNRITSREALDELMRQSSAKPVVLFKHSLTCPLSADAYQEMESLAGEVALIEVQRNRDLSSEIAQRTKVVHETPQVLVLRNGEAVWHQSHWNVKADEVLRALEENR
jgi:bacillithiol system protein YtxJ